MQRIGFTTYHRPSFQATSGGSKSLNVHHLRIVFGGCSRLFQRVSVLLRLMLEAMLVSLRRHITLVHNSAMVGFTIMTFGVMERAQKPFPCESADFSELDALEKKS